MSRSVRRMLQLAIALAVTGGCAWLVVAELDIDALVAALAGARPLPLAVAFLLALSLPFWRAARLAALLPRRRRPGGGALTRVAAEVLLWNFLLPFKLGELSFPWLLHRRVGLSLGEALALFVLVRVSDVLAIAGLLLLGAASLPPLAAHGLALPAAFVGILLLVAPLLIVAVAARLQERPARARLARLAEGASHARSASARAAMLATTLGLWGSHALIAALALHAVGATANWGATLAASAAGNLAFALPVSGVLGLGPQQVAFASALEVAGVAWPSGVASALAVYATVLTAAVLAGLASWLMTRWHPETI